MECADLNFYMTRFLQTTVFRFYSTYNIHFVVVVEVKGACVSSNAALQIKMTRKGQIFLVLGKAPTPEG